MLIWAAVVFVCALIYVGFILLGCFGTVVVLVVLRGDNRTYSLRPRCSVRKMGLEPTRHECHKILSLARLPVPTLPHITIICDRMYYSILEACSQQENLKK